jgi:hypothetical protein
MPERFGVIYVPPPRGVAGRDPPREQGVHSLREGEMMAVGSSSHVTWWLSAIVDGVDAFGL